MEISRKKERGEGGGKRKGRKKEKRKGGKKLRHNYPPSRLSDSCTMRLMRKFSERSEP